MKRGLRRQRQELQRPVRPRVQPELQLPLLLRRGKSEFEPLRACGPPLGVMDNMTYTTRSIAFEPGDMLFLYTDGVTEAEDPDSGQFGTQRLEQILLAMRGEPAGKVVEKLIEQVAVFANGAVQSDDITCIAIVRDER